MTSESVKSQSASGKERDGPGGSLEALERTHKQGPDQASDGSLNERLMASRFLPLSKALNTQHVPVKLVAGDGRFFFLNAHAESTFFSQINQSANTNSPRHERSGICPRQRRTQTGGNSAVEKVEQGAE